MPKTLNAGADVIRNLGRAFMLVFFSSFLFFNVLMFNYLIRFALTNKPVLKHWSWLSGMTRPTLTYDMATILFSRMLLGCGCISNVTYPYSWAARIGFNSTPCSRLLTYLSFIYIRINTLVFFGNFNIYRCSVVICWRFSWLLKLPVHKMSVFGGITLVYMCSSIS